MPLSGSSCPDWDDSWRSEHERIALLVAYRLVVRDEAALPIGVDRVCDWHRRCFSGFVPVHYYAGNMRQVTLGLECLDTPIFVGPMAGSPATTAIKDSEQVFTDIRSRISNLEIAWPFLAPEEQLEEISNLAAILMGRFNKVHPFRNGNGRMTRFLLKWILARFSLRTKMTVTHRPSPKAVYAEAIAGASGGSYAKLASYIRSRIERGKPVFTSLSAI